MSDTMELTELLQEKSERFSFFEVTTASGLVSSG